MKLSVALRNLFLSMAILLVAGLAMANWILDMAFERRLGAWPAHLLVMASGALLLLGGGGILWRFRKQEKDAFEREYETRHGAYVTGVESSLHAAMEGMVQEVAERRRAEELLRRREDVLRTASRSLSSIVAMRSRDLTIPEVLEQLGQCLGASRAVFFESRSAGARSSEATLEYAWSKSGAYGVPTDGGTLSWAPGLLRWHTLLSCGIAVSGRMSEFPECEQEALKDWGLGSVMAIPVLGREQFWGFLGFEDVASDQDWGEADVSAVTTVATSLGEALEREQAGLELRRAKEHADAAEKLARALAQDADQAHRTKNEFLAAMNHEIRTPLNAVIGMTSLLTDSKLNPDQREWLETLRLSGTELLELINDILDYSGIEAGRIELEAIGFDLRAMVEDAMGMVADRLLADGKQLALFWDPTLPGVVVGDPSRFRQVLLNLLVLVARHCGSGNVSIHVSREQESVLDEEAVPAISALGLRVSVKDSATLLAQDECRRLMEPFTADVYRHFGGHDSLGLVVARRVLERMGGEFGIEYQDRGALEFWFRLQVPFKETDQTDITRAGDLQGLRVLVLDPRALERSMVLQMLELCGMDAVGTADIMAAGMELARSLAHDSPYDFVLVELPVDPEPILHSLKMASNDRVPKLIAMSRYPRKGEAQRARDNGFCAFLPKPLKLQVLQHTLAVLANGSELADSGTSGRCGAREGERKSAWKILVAEDNLVNQKVVVRLLRKLGHECDLVTDGQEALEACRSRDGYDLILMDCQMQGMDGWEATRQIRALESRRGAPRAPILALTADTSNGVAKLCMDAGMDDYLTKPISVSQLERVLEQYLEGASGFPISTFSGADAAYEPPPPAPR